MSSASQAWQAPETPRPVAPRAAPASVQPLPPQREEDDRTVYGAGPITQASPVAGVLVAVEGKLLGRVFRVFEGETVIGRSASLPDPFPDGSEWDKKISREHAKIVSSQGNFLIESLKPDQNPTLVNGEVVPADGMVLEDKSRIEMGRSTFVFLAVPTQ